MKLKKLKKIRSLELRKMILQEAPEINGLKLSEKFLDIHTLRKNDLIYIYQLIQIAKTVKLMEREMQKLLKISGRNGEN